MFSIISLTAVLAVGTPLPHVSIYVDASAPSPGIGTLQDPFPTIQDAINAAVPHDYIYVSPGVYQEALDIPFFLFIRAFGNADDTIIDATGIPATHAVKMAALVELTGFTITKRDGAGVLVEIPTSAPGEFGRTFRRNRVVDCPAGGIDLAGLVHPAVSESLVANCGPYGVRVREGASPFFTGMTVTGCAVGLERGSGLPPDGIAFFANSIMYGNTTDVVGFSPTALRNCLVGDPAFAGVNGNLAANPQWRSPAGGDFRLLSGSPALDAGDPLYTLSSSEFDVRGFGAWRRRDGNADGIVTPDCGCFERGGFDHTVTGTGPGARVDLEIDVGSAGYWWLGYGPAALVPSQPVGFAGTNPWFFLEESAYVLLAESAVTPGTVTNLSFLVPAWAVGQTFPAQAVGLDSFAPVPTFTFTNLEMVRCR